MRKRKQKLRKSIRTFYIVLAISIIAFCSATIFNKTVKKDTYDKKEIILTYTNKLNTTYDVDLKDNKFMDQKTIPMGKTYVTNLIDKINMKFDFSYDASKYTELTYSYSIVGVLNGAYSKNGTPQKVWEKEYVLLEETENKKSNNTINIKENIPIDVNEYNDEIYNFEKTLGMAITANLNVQLRVNIDGKINDTQINDNYVSNIDIELGEQTTEITGKLTDETEDTLYKTTTNNKNNTVVIAVNVILIVAALAWLRYISVNTTNLNTVRNNYKLELNRILKSCEDKIVKLSRNVDLNGKEVIEVNDFGELIKLSEELYKPILYWNSNQKEESEFFVITNSVIYKFILKVK